MKNQDTSPFALLRDKNILAILDGDTNCGEITPEEGRACIKVSMPYLSGPTLCNISNTFGLSESYGWSGGAQSRWVYLDNLLEHCIDTNKVSDLLGYLFSKQQFVDKLKGYPPTTIESVHEQIVNTVIEQINGILYFGSNELIMSGSHYQICAIGSTVTIETPIVNKIDRNYIKSLSDRAMTDIAEGNYDSAITKSRTLLEEVFCYVIEKRNMQPSESGDIGKLYNQVKQIYNMHQDKETDKRINMLLSGLEKIVSSIAQMRNEGSDSHGVGSRRVNISEHHTRLFVNSAMTMADFILAVGNRTLSKLF